MITRIQSWKAPTLYYLMAGFAPHLLFGMVGAWILSAMVPESPMFAQIIRATLPAIAALYAVPFVVRKIASKNLFLQSPKVMVYRAAVLYGTIHILLVSILVFAGIVISSYPELYPYFFVMVIGNVAGLVAFYRTSKKQVRELLLSTTSV